MKTLVAFFSASGVTEHAAQELARLAHADLYQILPQTPYTRADLDWTNSHSRSTVEMKDLDNAEAYEVIFVGFPIWWYTAPTIINTFLDTYNFAGKIVVPFATSGGSSIDKTQGDLKRSYPALNWKPGRLLNRVNPKEVEAWLKELGIV